MGAIFSVFVVTCLAVITICLVLLMLSVLFPYALFEALNRIDNWIARLIDKE